jgi:hypothetical protein
MRALDCLVINELVARGNEFGNPFQTVRSPFLEGETAFPGSAILKESHIQISVLDSSCILGVFRPNFPVIRQLQESIIRDQEKPSRELFQDMVDRGVIDSEGKLLIYVPQPPRAPRKPRRKPG